MPATKQLRSPIAAVLLVVAACLANPENVVKKVALRGATAGPFITSDLWRGSLTSCHQTTYHKNRKYRYFPIELTIDSVANGEITATFVTHADHSFYELKGDYDDSTRRLFLRPTRGKIGVSWEVCDAEAYLSLDRTTLSGRALCDAHGECDEGGGEFILKHDRTEFVVEGAGLAAVNGLYKQQQRTPLALVSEKPVGGRLYDGAPVYLQTCGDSSGDLSGEGCDIQHAIVHEVLGQYGFWRIVEAADIARIATDTEKPIQAAYAVCSEDVYPPETGWRPESSQDGPPPNVRPDVSSMFASLKSRFKITEKTSSESNTQTHSMLLLLMIGVVLWTLLILVGKAGCRWRSEKPKGVLSSGRL